MISIIDLVLRVGEIGIIVLGGLLVLVSLKAYRRDKSRPLLLMSLGFAVIIVGSLTGEVVLELLGYPLVEAHALEHSIVAAGLLILVYSIYGARG